MAVFTSGSSERSPDASGRHGSRESGLSIIASGMRVVGELQTNGVVKVEGIVEGSVHADQEVLVAKDGLVQGDIHTRQAIIGGRVVGSIHGFERVEVQQDSQVQGDITTKRLIVHEGGEVNGNIRMGDTALEEPEPKTPTAESTAASSAAV
jgi:cytoskeletal protein CcmA (bactofilin family)